jgi:hypothetical protein
MASGYNPEWVENVRAGCLYLATVLGDLLLEHMVIVGGLVPGLLISQDALPRGTPRHAGTQDLDLGLKVGILEGEVYAEVARRLREAGFQMDRNERGNPTLQRWHIVGEAGRSALVDFLIAPTSPADHPRHIKHLQSDFGAIITPGLDLAFRDGVNLRLSGRTIMGEHSTRDLGVCGPGAFVVLKALAFGTRGLAKDAYDLFYVARNYESGPAEVARRLAPLLDSPDARRAIQILRRDFASTDSIGPARVARFLGEEDHDTLRREVVGFIKAVLPTVD